MLAIALAALTAHSSLMSGPMDDHAMSNAAAICMVVGGSLAVVGVAVFAVRRLARRPLWLIPAPHAPALPFVAVAPGFLVRAGPPPAASLQVFRL